MTKNSLKLKDFLTSMCNQVIGYRTEALTTWHKHVAESEPPELSDGGVIKTTLGSPAGVAALGDKDGPLLLETLTLEVEARIASVNDNIILNLRSRKGFLSTSDAPVKVVCEFKAQPIPEALARVRDKLVERVVAEAAAHLKSKE